MSGLLKGIGKIFKAVVKVAKVVIPIALAVAAVVFTGGAALGILPTFAGAIGGLVGSLGLSTTLAGALTGSIVSAGFGAAAGLVTGGVKGAQKGALFGAATGGLLGAASPATFGFGTTGALKTAATTTAETLGHEAGHVVANATGLLPNGGLGIVDATGIPALGDATGLGSTIANAAPAAIKSVAPAVTAAPAAAVAPAAPVAAAPAAAAPAAGNGLLNSFLSNPAGITMAGHVIGGLFTPSQSSQELAYQRGQGERLFGGVYDGGAGGGTGVYPTPHIGVQTARRFRLNPQTLQVEEVEPAR